MSSESESSLPVESEALPVDNKHIINEVAKRPALYDKTIKQYSDRNVKAKLWLEVYQNVCRDWHILTDTERKYRGNTIQKKWKNMKDSFAKELAAQEGKSGQAAPAKKKKYVHFDSMLFLIPSMKKRETTSNVSSPTPTQPSKAILSTASTPANNSEEPLQSAHNTSTKRKNKNCFREANNSTDYEQQLLDILRGKNDDDDEEKNFALMLVPMLRKLDDDQKHYAKVEILNVLKKAKTLSTIQSPQYSMNNQSFFRDPRGFTYDSPSHVQNFSQPQRFHYIQSPSPHSSSLDLIRSPAPQTTPQPSPSPQQETTCDSPLYLQTFSQPQKFHYIQSPSPHSSLDLIRSPAPQTTPQPSPSPQQEATISNVQIISDEIIVPGAATYFSQFTPQFSDK